jgi:hypothetical protein
MAGSLIKIAETTVSSSTASVTLTGIDSTFDVYMVRYSDVFSDTDDVVLQFRVTKSGSADTTANYDEASKSLNAHTSFANNSGTNDTKYDQASMGTAGNEQANGIMYLFNFNNSSEFSFFTDEQTSRNRDGNLTGVQGGGVHTLTVAQATDGVNYSFSSGNIASGTFKLYGLKK